MALPSELLANFLDPRGAVQQWTAKLAHQCLNESNNKNQSIRTSERILKSEGLLPNTLTINEIEDEYGLPLNRVVANSIDQQARESRLRSLILQLHPHPVGGHVLFANDARSGRQWVYLEVNFTETTLKDSLELFAENKETIFWPHRTLVKRVRELFENKHIESNAGKTLHFGFAAYQSSKYRIRQEGRKKPMTSHSTNSHLSRLEAESINIIRETVAQAEKPVMLYSIGKDSAVMLRLAQKAFYPAPLPFPLLHVDTRWKFQEMYRFRDELAATNGIDLLVHVNPEGVKRNINPLDHGSALHTGIMKTEGLKQALDTHKFDVAFGGARRDEEKSRAKERVFSFRNTEHRWDPKNQRPELWSIYNAYKRAGESIRVFPLSNWTELDVWQYIYQEDIPLVPLYFAAERPVVNRDGMLLLVDDDRLKLHDGEKVELKKVRFRTLGCYPLTGAVESSADDLEGIILELVQSKVSERQGRAIDSDASASMEKKKQEGYF